MADGEAKGKNEILTETDQRIVNRRGLSRMEIEVMRAGNRDVLDAAKRVISKETA